MKNLKIDQDYKLEPIVYYGNSNHFDEKYYNVNVAGYTHWIGAWHGSFGPIFWTPDGKIQTQAGSPSSNQERLALLQLMTFAVEWAKTPKFYQLVLKSWANFPSQRPDYNPLALEALEAAWSCDPIKPLLNFETWKVHMERYLNSHSNHIHPKLWMEKLEKIVQRCLEQNPTQPTLWTHEQMPKVTALLNQVLLETNADTLITPTQLWLPLFQASEIVTYLAKVPENLKGSLLEPNAFDSLPNETKLSIVRELFFTQSLSKSTRLKALFSGFGLLNKINPTFLEEKLDLIIQQMPIDKIFKIMDRLPQNSKSRCILLKLAINSALSWKEWEKIPIIRKEKCSLMELDELSLSLQHFRTYQPRLPTQLEERWSAWTKNLTYLKLLTKKI